MNFKVSISSNMPDPDKLERLFRAAALHAFKKVGAHAKARAVDNTPIDTSRLRGSISFLAFSIKDAIGVNLTAGPVLNPETKIPYAKHVHENFLPAGTIQARLKQATPEGIVGGEYLTRVANFHIAKYKQFIRSTIAKSMKAGRVVDGNLRTTT